MCVCTPNKRTPWCSTCPKPKEQMAAAEEVMLRDREVLRELAKR